MKKLLVVHTEYQIPGGEDIAVNNEAKFLSENFDVKKLIFSNNIDNYFSQSLNFIKNKNNQSIRILHDDIKSFKPDRVYIHNTWFKASLGVFDLLRDLEMKPLLKLHNYRYDCTKSFLVREHLKNNNPCKACGLEVGNNRVFNKYFEDSYLKSFFVNSYGKKYFNVLQNYNLDLIVLTNFHRAYLKDVNKIDRDISVIPNIIEPQEIDKVTSNRPYLIYAGRISKEKGVEELIKSFIECNFENLTLKIVGDGPLMDYLKIKYNKNNIQFSRFIPNKEVLTLINNALAVVTATKLYEGQPTLLCEASAMGIPSIFPKTGGISEFFPENYPLSFDQFNYESLKEKLKLILTIKNLNQIGIANKQFINNYLENTKLLNKFERLINGQ